MFREMIMTSSSTGSTVVEEEMSGTIPESELDAEPGRLLVRCVDEEEVGMVET